MTMSDQKAPSFHITAEQARGLLEGSIMDDERTVLMAHLLAKCEECLKLVRDIAFPGGGEEQDYSGLIRRLELAFVVHTHDVQAERRLAAEHWEVMRRLDSSQR